MFYKIAIVDDNSDDLERVYESIQKSILSKQINIKLYKFSDTKEFPKNIKFDVLFLDIDMPIISGFELAKEYRIIHKDTLIIFVTNHNELVFEACNIHPFDFVRKENLKVEIPIVIDEVVYKLTDIYPSITTYVNGNTYVINIDSILYCESFNHSTVIHFNESTLKVNQQLRDISILINTDYFKRVGKSYLVNMNKVTKFENGILFLENNNQVPISRRNKSKIKEYLSEVKKKWILIF